MAIIKAEPTLRNNPDGNTISLVKLLTPKELGDKCGMYARVLIPAGGELAVHEHHGNGESYHIISGKAIYNDNGQTVELGVGDTAYCYDGEKHGIKNASDVEPLIFMALIINS